MQAALELSEQAANNDEVPVGAVVVLDGRIIGTGSNAPISRNDSTAHAEMLAIRAACEHQQNYRLTGATLYVTLEPCPMCAGAIVHSRISRVVCATTEPRAGAGGSVMNILRHPQLNHRCEVEMGLYQQESSDMLRQFFRVRR